MAGADGVAVKFVGLPDLDVEGAAEAGDVGQEGEGDPCLRAREVAERVEVEVVDGGPEGVDEVDGDYQGDGEDYRVRGQEAGHEVSQIQQRGSVRD